ncbi:hypothetical protein J2X85_001520 [Microbacterium trichothecenolyticum]|uniref:hypothetical protein n=1 Tax=Microbacterium trichothecenolyticum TaxID=69370 RepID=UPI002866EFB2|nr:hypothetical protein [Microbacterium trichothecenolyticum]MDR7184497.1 hypothetical protein [Microbacterium trichothecenolyticum]
MALITSFATMVELDRLISAVITPEGDSWRMAAVTGFTPWVALDAWRDWQQAQVAGFASIDFLLILHVVADAVFIAGYALTAVAIIRACLGAMQKSLTSSDSDPNPHAPTDQHIEGLSVDVDVDSLLRQKRRSLYVLLGILVAADVGEDLCVLVLVAYPSTALSGVQVVFTVIKWIALVALVTRALLGETLGAVVRRWLLEGISGVYGQRLGVVLVIGVAIMTIFTGVGVQDQLPDVYRGWIGYPEPGEVGGFSINVVPAGAALAVAALVAFGLFFFGRQRGYQYRHGHGNKRANLPAWIYFSLGLLLIALVLASIVVDRTFEPLTLVLLLAVLVLVPVSSTMIRLARQRHGDKPPEPLLPKDSHERADAVFFAGDAVVSAWLIVVFLGPFISLIAPLTLNAMGSFTASKFAESTPQLLGWAALLWVGAVLAPTLAWATMEHFYPLTPRQPSPAADGAGDGESASQPEPAAIRNVPDQPVGADAASASVGAYARAGWKRVQLFFDSAFVAHGVEPHHSKGARVIGRISMGASVAAILLIALFPFFFAQLGPVALLYTLAGAWAALLGWLIIALGRRRPPEVFESMRLRSTPVLTLATVLPFVIATAVASPTPHAVSFDARKAALERPTLAQAFDTWRASACVTSVSAPAGEVPVKVLTLVAAQGGGIRAATWTVDVLRELPRASDCAARSVMISAGASGGSVGLAYLARPGSDAGKAISIGPISGPDALAVDTAGLLGSDLVAGVTGLTIPSFVPHDGGQWRDRADLHATVWEDSAKRDAIGLGARYDVFPHSPIGYAVFNATDSATNCKVLISQVDLASRAERKASDTCAGLSAELTNTVDLFDYLGKDCASGFSWSTAALLSARFPFVSPSARLSPSTVPAGCAAEWDMQLLDGGLIDNSALGTTADVLSELSTMIRAANAADTSGTVIVPVVLFAANEPGADVVRDMSQTRPEITAPIAAMDGAQAVQTSPSVWLTRLSQTLDDVCGGDEETHKLCLRAVSEVRQDLPGSTIVVAPSTTPAITVPLGWSLSSFARSRLRYESDQQRLCGRDQQYANHDFDFVRHAESLAVTSATCRSSGDYGRFGTYLNLFDTAVTPAEEPPSTETLRPSLYPGSPVAP